MNADLRQTQPSHLEIALLHRVEPARAGTVGPYADAVTEPETLERYLTDRSSWAKPDAAELAGSALPELGGRNGFLLTCDDGYRSFLEQVLPLLEVHEAPCVLFVTTSFVGGAELPYEMTLADLITENDRLRLADGGCLELDEPEARRAAYLQLRMLLRDKTPAERRGAIERLLEVNGMPALKPKPEEFLSWDELIELDRHPQVTLGAHTRTHPLLTAVSWPQAFAEIWRSRRELERRLGHPVDAFAYPYGACGRAVRQFVRLSGFRYAFTTQRQMLTPGARVDRFTLPRTDLAVLVASAEPARG